MKHIGITLIVIILLFLPSMASAQTEIVTRPKIGYVFSGGGAKGMAHVGILKVFEEIGLQPDYITGTSMGSIIGALYAIGYSAVDIIRIGEEAARTQIEILSALADSINSIQPPPQKRELPANDSLWITDITVPV